MTPKEVLESTTKQVRDVIDQILQIEKAQKHIQNLSANRSVETGIAEDILRVVKREIS